MRILYLNTTYSGGGAEKVVRQVYDGMKARGHEVYEIVCYNRRGGVEDDHVKVLYSGTAGKILQRLQTGNRNNRSMTIPYAIGYIRQFVKKHEIDVIHLHNPHDSFLGIRDIASLQRICPVIWTLHDFWALTGHCAVPVDCTHWVEDGCRKCGYLDKYPRVRVDKCHELFKKKERFLAGQGIAFTVPSDWMETQVKHSYLKEEDCRVIYNSLDPSVWAEYASQEQKQALREQYGIPKEKLVLAFVTADLAIPTKGMPLLLEALKKLDPEKVCLVTAGRCTEQLQRELSSFEMKSFGYISDQKTMNEFYGLADLVVNPSLYETFGLVGIEAMASGTPVISFDICAMREIIGEDGGWLVEQTDAGNLAETLVYLTTHPEELKAKAAVCRSRVTERYGESRMLDQFETLYKLVKYGQK